MIGRPPHGAPIETYPSDNIRWSVPMRLVHAMMRKTVTPPFRWPIDYDQYREIELRRLGRLAPMPNQLARQISKTGVDTKERNR